MDLVHRTARSGEAMLKLTNAHRELLNDAYALIEKGDENFICVAVAVAADDPFSDDVRTIKAAISDAIGGYMYLTTWVRKTGYRGDCDAPQRTLRLAWIDKMLHDGEIR